MKDLNQITKDAARSWYSRTSPAYTERIDELASHIKTVVEKVLEEAFTEHVWKFSDDWTEGAISALERKYKCSERDRQHLAMVVEEMQKERDSARTTKDIRLAKFDPKQYPEDRIAWGAGLAIGLLREVMAQHRDKDSPDYNECDKPGEECQWCTDAANAIEALAETSK